MSPSKPKKTVTPPPQRPGRQSLKSKYGQKKPVKERATTQKNVVYLMRKNPSIKTEQEAKLFLTKLQSQRRNESIHVTEDGNILSISKKGTIVHLGIDGKPRTPIQLDRRVRIEDRTAIPYGRGKVPKYPVSTKKIAKSSADLAKHQQAARARATAVTAKPPKKADIRKHAPISPKASQKGGAKSKVSESPGESIVNALKDIFKTKKKS